MHITIQTAILLLKQAKKELELTPVPGFVAAEGKVAEAISFIESIDAARNIPVKKEATRYVGDIGVVRKVLDDFGFAEKYAQYYNDKSKVTGKRRIKCNAATKLFDADTEVRRTVIEALRTAFEGRVESIYWVKAGSYMGGGMQLCIKLKQDVTVV